MAAQNLILIDTLCTHYEIEISFFDDLDDLGLIPLEKIEKDKFIFQDSLSDLERIIRLRNDLNVNLEGIDVIFNLLQKIERLQHELITIDSKLGLYENRRR